MKESSVDNTQSPLFDVVTGEFAYLIRTCYTGEFYTVGEMNGWNKYADNTPQRKRAEKIIKIHKDDTQCHPVCSIEEAEDKLLDEAYCVTEPWDTLPFGLRRQAALVAARGRRGYANYFLMHPSMAYRIPLENWLDCERFMFRPIGRWFEMGVMPKRDRWGSTVYVSEHLPENQAYVFYKTTSIDAPAMMLDKDCSLRLVIPSGVDILYNVCDYITKVTFE